MTLVKVPAVVLLVWFSVPPEATVKPEPGTTAPFVLDVASGRSLAAITRPAVIRPFVVLNKVMLSCFCRNGVVNPSSSCQRPAIAVDGNSTLGREVAVGKSPLQSFDN